jgi:hypothetical protein
VPIPILAIIFGGVVLAFGLWDYSGYGRHTSAKRLWMFIWLVYAEVPIGLGFTLVGLGALVGQHPISDWLMVIWSRQLLGRDRAHLLAPEVGPAHLAARTSGRLAG